MRASISRKVKTPSSSGSSGSAAPTPAVNPVPAIPAVVGSAVEGPDVAPVGPTKIVASPVFILSYQ